MGKLVLELVLVLVLLPLLWIIYYFLGFFGDIDANCYKYYYLQLLFLLLLLNAVALPVAAVMLGYEGKGS